MTEISIFSITLMLFIVMDPIGNIPIYLGMMEHTSPHRRKWVLLREMLIALGLMLLFNFIGEYIFSILDVSDTAVKLSSGVILFLTAIKILFPAANSFRSYIPQEEPFIIPLATPLIAGPSTLATVMLFAHMEERLLPMLSGIFIAWFMTLTVLFFSPYLKRVLKLNGLLAAERLMAMILVMISIQRFMEGAKDLIK